MSSRSALARHPLALVGGVITTVTAVVFIALAIAEAIGLFENPYAGLVVFVALPALFVLGLLLIPAGMWLQRRRLRRDPSADMDWPTLDFRRPAVRRTTLLIVALTGVNLMILLLAGYGSLHWMESPGFCGQACHTPMHPQFTAWQDAPHSSVACTQCHIGEGARAFVHYKLDGVRQLVHVVSGNIPEADSRRRRPASRDSRCAGTVTGPGRDSATSSASSASTPTTRRIRRPRRSCRCSWAVPVRRRRAGAPSTGTPIRACRSNSPTPTSSGRRSSSSSTPTRRAHVREYAAEGTTPDELAKGSVRAMDCVDCHNVAGASRRTGAGAGGGCGDRRRPDRPRPAVRPPRRRAPDEGEPRRPATPPCG